MHVHKKSIQVYTRNLKNQRFKNWNRDQKKQRNKAEGGGIIQLMHLYLLHSKHIKGFVIPCTPIFTSLIMYANLPLI